MLDLIRPLSLVLLFFTPFAYGQKLAGSNEDPEFRLKMEPGIFYANLNAQAKGGGTRVRLRSATSYNFKTEVDQRLSYAAHFLASFDILRMDWKDVGVRTLKGQKEVYGNFHMGFYNSSLSWLNIGALIGVQQFPLVDEINNSDIVLDNVPLFGPGLLVRIHIIRSEEFSLFFSQDSFVYLPESSVDHKLHGFFTSASSLHFNFSQSKEWRWGLVPFVTFQSCDTSRIKETSFFAGARGSFSWNSW